MRRLLGTLVLALVLAAPAGCGEDTDDADVSGAESATASNSGTPGDPTPSGSAEPDATVVEIVSETAAGGEQGGPAIRIDRPAGMARLTRDFRTPRLAAKIRSVVRRTQVEPGQALYGAVIAVGCDVPPSASVEVTDGTVVITPGKVVDPMPECFAAVTSVAIALVDLSAG
jgi:hypothetical protein